ncbi:hypothetical protein [Sphingomonas koreensis]
MEKLITIAAIAATLAFGSQAVGRDATKMTVKMKPRDRVVAEEHTIQPAVQKGPNRPAVHAPDGKSISTKGVKSTAQHPGGAPPK